MYNNAIVDAEAIVLAYQNWGLLTRMLGMTATGLKAGMVRCYFYDHGVVNGK